MNIDPKVVSKKEIYRILISTVTPRPIAWVSSMDEKNKVNLAPFSFFNVVSVNPPILGFSPLLNGEAKIKDTLRNISKQGEFVVNIVSHNYAEQMNQTSAPYGADINEMEQVKLTPAASSLISVPSVQEALVRYECRLHDIISFGDQPLAGQLILGKICSVYLDDQVFHNNRIDIQKLDTIGRMEGSFYSTTRDRFSIARPVSDASDTEK
ncbi:MAG: flavin reductase family protein [Endozoicomonas sp. (ex Botrylloides leachii)]|nr:flavin reductase family protein [Endozoicomonas sp. (ex Botrylloides leachii)]